MNESPTKGRGSEADDTDANLDLVARMDLGDIGLALDESTIIAITDQTGKITYANDMFCRISGYSLEELIGQDHRIINSGFHPPEFFRDLWRTIAGGEIWRGEVRNRAKNGSIYWVNTTIVPFLNKRGKPLRYIAVRHDITAQKLAENSLEEINSLLAQTHDAIVTWPYGEGIASWNENAEDLYGFSVEEAKGKHFTDLLSTVYPVPEEEYRNALEHDGFWVGELEQVTKSGIKLVVENRQVVSKSGQKNPVVLSTSHDVTERRKSEERIRQQASLLDQTKDAIMVCDLDYRILYWNKGAEAIYGWMAWEILGKDICDIICGGDRSVIEESRRDLSERGAWQKETTQYTKDEEPLTISTRWTLVRDDLNTPDYFLVVNTDVSELKVVEEHLYRAQRMESIGTLAGGMAHDLNNVLSPILMAVEMLQSNDEIPTSAESWLSIIRENTDRGADLIKQVLTFARGVEGDRLSVQIKHIIKDLVKVLKETLPKHIEVTYKIAPKLSTVTADPTQIHQVLMNMAVNARDAMPEGGKLKIEAENAEIAEAESRKDPEAKPGPYVRLVISDTGVGMDARVLERIFDPFFTTKETGKGTGLGLSTSSSIIRSHNGFVRVSSELNKGSRFEIFLPAEARPSEASPVAGDARAPKGDGELVLLVDDEPDIVDVTRAALENAGYRVITASNGVEAAERFRQEGSDVRAVITDIAMPLVGGVDLMRILRSIDPQVRIIAISGLPMKFGKDEAQARPDAEVGKPFTIEQLLTALTDVLG